MLNYHLPEVRKMIIFKKNLQKKLARMNLYQEFEKKTGKRITVTRTFDCKLDESQVKIDVWNDDYISFLQEKIVKLLAAPDVSKSEGIEREIMLPFDFIVWYSGMEKDKIGRAYQRYLREVKRQ